MSESLGIENIFEGVETKEELKMVKQLHGQIIQGYFFSKPLEVSQMEEWFDLMKNRESLSKNDEMNLLKDS